ncbi:hypothetical protein L596_009263 [Steinernema carpocapsae]|uniref:Receptor L-domain domain-containing protein n=1 Tax=Steinernema carpocapsae TaxID=34508 RepID=A0A4U5PF45_STECR|nr:hypothetical protein L596_009263 [Steinernema carpocapsae]
MRKRGFSSSLALKFILALLLPCVLGEEIYANDTQVPEKICGSIHIRNPIGFSSGPKGTQNYFCTVVEGDFTFMIPRESRQHHIDYESAPHVFPYLREITGHVVIYNNIGLVSLSEMLPELRVIGGEKLIVNYALVVYKNENLEDVGLQKLALIKNGGVWITENPRLCNTRNIDWKLITSSPVAAVRTDEEKYLSK